MKQHIFRWFVPILLLALLSACSKDDSSKIEYKWQLQRYEFANGTSQQVDSVYYNLQGGSFSAICMLGLDNYESFFGNYTLQDGKLSIVLLPEYEGRATYRKYFAWENYTRSFEIAELTSSTMRLKYGDVIYVFRKY